MEDYLKVINEKQAQIDKLENEIKEVKELHKEEEKQHLKNKYLNKYIKAFGRYLYVTNVINKTDVNCLEIYYDKEYNQFSIDSESCCTLHDECVKIITKEEFMQYMNDCISKTTQCLK